MTTTAVTEKPITLKDDEVRAILDDTRTTLEIPLPAAPRRGPADGEWWLLTGPGMTYTSNLERIDRIDRVTKRLIDRTERYVPLGEWLADRCPYRVGTRIWVREAFAMRSDVDPAADRGKAIHYLHYRATYEGNLGDEWHSYGRWRAARTMPRWASRITLEVLSVCPVERDGRWSWFLYFRRVEG